MVILTVPLCFKPSLADHLADHKLVGLLNLQMSISLIHQLFTGVFPSCCSSTATSAAPRASDSALCPVGPGMHAISHTKHATLQRLCTLEQGANLSYKTIADDAWQAALQHCWLRKCPVPWGTGPCKRVRGTRAVWNPRGFHTLSGHPMLECS